MTRIAGPTRAQLDQAADQYADLLDRELAHAIDRTVAWLGDQFDTDDLGVIPKFWADRLDDLLAPTLALALHAGSADIRRQLRRHLGLTAAAWNGVPVTSQQLADAYLATARNRLVGVGDLTWQLAREQLLEGQRAGESIAQLRDRVASATGLSSPRAGVIARTEILDALNYGAHAEMAATGLDGTKTWLATGDSRTREDHVHADGQKVGVKDKFTVGGWPADRPHDPALPAEQAIQCRCALTFEVDLDDVSLEPAQPAQEQAQEQVDHQILGAVWVADAIRRGVTADDLAALLSLAPFLPDQEPEAETAAAETFHLAGKHNQKTHNPRHRAQAKSEAGRLIGSATKNEPAITGDLQGLAGEHGAELVGLPFRLKTEASLERKISSDMVAAPADATAGEIAGKIGDTVRYTAAFPPDRYAAGTAGMQQDLVARGYTQVKHKNTWSPDSPYRGINQQWDSPAGQRFELQFHTPESFDLKNGLQHRLYEEYRLPKTTAVRRQQLDTQMKAAARALPMPPGALEIGAAGPLAGGLSGPEGLERAGPLGGDLDQVVFGLPGQQAVASVGIPAPIGRERLDDPVGGGAEQRQRPVEGELGWVGDGEVPHEGTSFQSQYTREHGLHYGDVKSGKGSASETVAVTIPVAGSQEGKPMPWSVRKNAGDCSGYAVVNTDTGKMVPGGCHASKAKAEAMVRALYANSGDEAKAAGDLEHFAAKVDGTSWDANAAMSSCGDAACYRAICAGRKAGPPDQRGSWALPHHKSAGSPPNAAGVRAALARFSATEGLQNAGAARAHLDAHMATIRNQSEEASVSATTTEDLEHTSVDDGQEPEELADQSKGHCPPGKTWNPALGRCVSPKKAKMGAEDGEELEAEEAEVLGGKPNPGTDKDKRLAENRKKKASKRDAMAADPEESATEGAWEGILTIEGIPTGDGREFAADSLVFAETPLPFTYQSPTHGGQPGPAVDIGVIDDIWRDETEPRIIRGRGRVDMKDPIAADYYRKVDEKFLRGVSIDLDDRDPITDVEYVWSDDLKAWASERGLDEELVPEVLPPSKSVFLKGRVRGAALLSMPAFVEAQIWTAGNEPPPLPDLAAVEEIARTQEAERDKERTKEREAVAAAAVVTRLDEFRPPTEWFQNPELGQRSPITLTAEGRVYGHAWRSGECHIGYGGECVTPPEEDEFPFFTQGSVLCADGSRVAVGQITIGTGHAPLRLGQRAAAEHYDNTGSVVADVAIGMDRVGAWVAGALRPGATPQQVYALRASGQVSGDWRSIGGRLRLVALLGVNVPGFPVPRAEARVAGGQVQALVAAGMLDVGPKVDWEAEIEQRALRSMRDRALAAFGDD